MTKEAKYRPLGNNGIRLKSKIIEIIDCHLSSIFYMTIDHDQGWPKNI